VYRVYYNAMAREFCEAYERREENKFSIDKEYVYIRCDDNSVYKFESFEDRPFHSLQCSFDPDGTKRNTSSHKRLPDNIEDAAEEIFTRVKK